MIQLRGLRRGPGPSVTTLGDTAFNAAFAAGKPLPLEQAVAKALVKEDEPCDACAGYGVISSFRFLDLRHTYAALSLAAGVDIFTVSRRMGHSSITVTSDRYGHLYQGHSEDAEAIERLFKKGKS